MSAPARPQLMADYQGYCDGRGEVMTRELVTAAFTLKYGQPPREVWPSKHLWLAGPVPAASPKVASGGGGEDLPAPEMAMVASDETTEAAPLVAEQARLL